ncbi:MULTISPECIES: class I adenylate-forming enzyme family protein [Rhodopseudomonas]|uniref:4-coumarate--CoA ligase n=1 Tax=Rhodopseudomonas palustris TaxID=1076 RepID=A0A0D7E217_RHOPL|nr:MULTISPECIES: class I adenylate-forming enzyme family protein [Rhodopseudomonas]KIZ34879.1 4-coumarate--CoA ligase [Rhodopseudomonas palustris]MDF3809640.1 class I adenylate-forming enzyme family protein [Rhodopseudomonas sp. BAL398]WOK17283.1 class I adenylate-forming enzyme family protein [Rhodopseudomonas sp. BAL398]
MPDFISLDALVANTAAKAPQRIAVIDGERQLDYAGLNDLINRVAASLQADGLKPRDVISICALSSIEYVATFLGALRAGVAVAPLAPSSTPQDFAAMVKDSGAKILFMDATTTAAMGEAATGPLKVSLDDGGWGRPFSAWCTAPGTLPQPVTIDPDWIFNIIYSSGTTGTPKGIVHTHYLRWRQYGQLDPLGYGPDAVTVLSTPLYSNTTLVCFNPTVAGGGTIVLMKKFDAKGFLELSQQHRATHAMLVPVQYRRIMNLPEFGEFDLSSYRMKFCTSAPFAAELKADILKRWPGGLTELYGMTEGGGSCALLAHEHPDKLHTVGQPMPDHEVRLIDEDGKPVAVGEIGEIVGRSPVMMQGYLNQPQKTAETFWHDENGTRFVRTGDIGRFDADGFLTLMDRKKDMIISGGFNIYPSDIEAIVSEHADVLEVAVVGMPSEDWGETPVAFVVGKPDAAIDAAALKAWTNSRVGKTQRLADVVVTEMLPRSAIGKVLKRELRDSRVKVMADSAAP